MLVNLEKRRALCSTCPSDQSLEASRHISAERKIDIMRHFYRNTVGSIFPDTFLHSPHAVDKDGGEFNYSNI